MIGRSILMIAGLVGIAAVADAHPAVRQRGALHHGIQHVAPTLAAARRARTRCIGIDNVAGAIVFGDRAVELTMTDHHRWRMTFEGACPALGFYQGFYYRRAVAGELCASRDAVLSRAGSTCPIVAITPVAR